MVQATIDRLFSKSELHYNENMHQRLFSKIHSVLIDRSAERLLNQDEYLVQATIIDFLTNHLRNTIFSAQREWQYIDNAIIHTTSGEPMVLYEVKSFIKPQENRISPRAIFKDLLKLAIKKKQHPFIEAYMVVAGKTKVPKDALNNAQLLLPNKFIDINNRTSVLHDLEYFKKLRIENNLLDRAKELNIKKISISPSRWRNYDGMCAISWRINKL